MVKGLRDFCHQNVGKCSEQVDLIQVARQRGGIILVVDFFGFVYIIMGHFWRSMTRVSRNSYLPFEGGEYQSLDAYLTKLVTHLKAVGIELLFIVDGAPGSSEDTVKQKLTKWKQSERYEIKSMQKVVEMTRGNKNVSTLANSDRICPVLLEVHMFETLRACGCQLKFIPCGEADFFIAKELQSNEKAFATLSDDTDFLVYPGGALICKENFDPWLARSRPFPVRPSKLICNVLRTELVAQCLQLSDPSQMVELSILAGNDSTSPFVRGGIYSRLGLPHKCTMVDLARWIRTNGSVDNHPVFHREMQSREDFRSSVEHSRRFYNLSLEEERPDDPLFNLIYEGIESGCFSPPLMEMHKGFFWRRVMVEDVGAGEPSSEIAMIPFRSLLYQRLLPPGAEVVTEHGRAQEPVYECAMVRAATDDDLKSITLDTPSDIEDNLQQFDRIMSHLEPAPFQKTWFDRFGRKNGFICYILRYFLMLNWEQNLLISEKEFLALVAMVMGRREEKWYQQVNIRPSTRCVTLGNWFQNIYRHAYYFLGKLLHLTHEFPFPREIFSGSVWTAFYTCSSEEVFEDGVRQVGRDTLMQCQRDMDDVIKEKRHVIRYLTEHVFFFDDRY